MCDWALGALLKHFMINSNHVEHFIILFTLQFEIWDMYWVHLVNKYAASVPICQKTTTTGGGGLFLYILYKPTVVWLKHVPTAELTIVARNTQISSQLRLILLILQFHWLTQRGISQSLVFIRHRLQISKWGRILLLEMFPSSLQMF